MAFRTGLSLLHLLVALALLSSLVIVKGESPYKFYTWTVTYGIIYPLGVPQQVILINGQFPGPKLDVVTNDNIILNLINKLDQPFLLTWNGIKQRKNSWQDGVLGTNCPIPPNSNFTYKFQTKDQIGTYNYFPSTAFHKAAGGFGAINVYARPRIPIPYPLPVEDFTLLIGDWFKTNHKTLQQRLDSGVACNGKFLLPAATEEKARERLELLRETPPTGIEDKGAVLAAPPQLLDVGR
ncbi:hypothetical protein F2Q69_00040244 [Brassica cretica]|uniref:Plastocyanin-like domain-containing protein n=1 Tax=Brassica cretica TaxID=69181 RepID=A0A8S9NC49_BRACR|nr:hypothetical protein F2Q69_00040244 [Brassica cretica]